MKGLEVVLSREEMFKKIGLSLAEELIGVFISRIKDCEKGLKPHDIEKICVYGRNVKAEDLFYVIGVMNERVERETDSKYDKNRMAARDLLHAEFVIGYGPSNGNRGYYDINLSNSTHRFFDENGEPIVRNL